MGKEQEKRELNSGPMGTTNPESAGRWVRPALRGRTGHTEPESSSETRRKEAKQRGARHNTTNTLSAEGRGPTVGTGESRAMVNSPNAKEGEESQQAGKKEGASHPNSYCSYNRLLLN